MANSLPAAIQWALATREEYYAAAKWCARKGFAGCVGDPLPEGLSSLVYTLINNDLYAFQLAVKRANNRPQ